MLDLTKPIQTRDGKKAKIVSSTWKATGRNDCILAAVEGPYGDVPVVALPNGRVCTSNEEPDDLVNVPKTYIKWLNIYPDPYNIIITPWNTKEDANASTVPGKDRIACVKIEYTEGEGL